MWVWNAVKVILNCTRGGIIRSHVALSTPHYISVRFSSLAFFFFFCFTLSSSLSVSPSCLKMTYVISGNSTACVSCVCRPIPVLWVGVGGQRGVNAHVLCVFVIFSARQNLNRNVSAPIALLQLYCLNFFGIISLLPFCWKGKPVGVGRCAGWLFLWLYLSLFPSTVKVLLLIPEPVLSQICKLLSEPDYITTQTNGPCLQVLSLKHILTSRVVGFSSIMASGAFGYTV